MLYPLSYQLDEDGTSLAVLAEVIAGGHGLAALLGVVEARRRMA